ncbi:MAG TPA: hypothetical protein VKS60_22945 [Stellaceae bacterium]|nr:hypothetical protein [Stellaceae bacterium]
MCKSAISVRGLVPGEKLGITLPHEHLLIDMSVRYRPADDEPTLALQPRLSDRWRLLREPAGYKANLVARDVQLAVDECKWLIDAGGRTIVDLTGLPEFAKDLHEIACRTDLNVIAATGYYIDASLPAWVHAASIEELAQRLIDDIETGGAEGVRRGAIGEIGIEGPTPTEMKCVRAAGRAQRRTGAPVFLHLMTGIMPSTRPTLDGIVAAYTEEGGALEQLVFCHQDGSGDDFAYQEACLRRGVWFEYDTFGAEGVFAFGDDYIQLPTDTQRIKELKRLIDAGYIGQLLVSQDVCYMTGRRSWGGWGFAHILDTLKPRFRAAGINDAAFEILMVENPRRLLSFA